MTKFVLTTSIKKLYKLVGRKKVVQGGTSAGKTFAILVILIDRAIKESNLEISIVSESMPHLKRGAMKDFLKLMMVLGRYNDSQWNRSNYKYTFINGSYIEFFSVEQPDKLRGARRNILYINECNNVPFEAYNQLSIRTSGDIWLDYNPSSAFWVHTDVVPEPDSGFLILTYKDNEGLPQTIVDDIESKREKAKTSAYWDNWWKVYGLGQIGSLEGVCIPDWTTVDKVPEESRLLGYGLDFGYTNDPTAVVALYKYDESVIADEIVYQTGLTNADIFNILRQKGVTGQTFIYADSAEPKSIEELKRLGLNIHPTKKGRDSIVYGINKINELDLLVTERSKNLTKELQSYIWAKDREGYKINKPIGGNDHIIDALRYGVIMLLDTGKGQYDIYGGGSNTLTGYNIY